MLTESEVNPDQQIPMPFKAADDYAQQVMGWTKSVDDKGMTVQRDVAYGPHRLHRYNVFSPLNVVNAPVLIFWHGGGWTNGYRDYNTFMAPHITALGCVLVSPSYRLVTEAKFPAAFDDGLAALTHVSQHIASSGGDAKRIYLGGHSAGAHLAALVALRSDVAVRGCLPISGIMDLHHPSPASGSLEERVYSMVLNDPSEDAVMSPICWTAGNRVPFDLTVGQHDSVRVRLSNRRMFELLRLQNAGVAFHDNPDHSHFDTHTSLHHPDAPWYGRLAKMLARH
jgi:acetyl esterase/lipase